MTEVPDNRRSDRYRVWIVSYQSWTPQDCWDTPPNAVAMEPAQDGTMTTREAFAYVGAFNRATIARGERIWAVGLLVTTRYEGDAQPGERLVRGGDCGSAKRKKNPPSVCQAPTLDGLPPREILPDTSCGVPVMAPSARQPHQTP